MKMKLNVLCIFCAMLVTEARSLYRIIPASQLSLRRIRQQQHPVFHTRTETTLIQLLRGGSTSYTGNMQNVLSKLDMFGTAVFAFAGAVTAGKSGMDLLGMTIVSIITATGGGTVRDMLLGAGPVFWIRQPIYLHICCVTTVLTYIIWPWLERKWGCRDSDKTVCVADAIGLAAFVVITTEKGDEYNLPALYWIVLGLISCTFGGILRDVLCARPARVLFPDRTLYATPVLLGSAVYTFCKTNRLMSDDNTAILTFLVTFSTRVWAFENSIRLPHWRFNKVIDTRHEQEHYS